MSEMLTKAQELIELTEKIAARIEADVTILKGDRPAALKPDDADRNLLMALYARSAAPFKAPAAMGTLPASVKTRLKAATERLHKALKEQSRLIARFRHVTEGVVKAVADAVAARQSAGVYAKSGHVVKPPAAPRASALTLNQAV